MGTPLTVPLTEKERSLLIEIGTWLATEAPKETVCKIYGMMLMDKGKLMAILSNTTE